MEIEPVVFVIFVLLFWVFMIGIAAFASKKILDKSRRREG